MQETIQNPDIVKRIRTLLLNEPKDYPLMDFLKHRMQKDNRHLFKPRMEYTGPADFISNEMIKGMPDIERRSASFIADRVARHIYSDYLDFSNRGLNLTRFIDFLDSKYHLTKFHSSALILLFGLLEPNYYFVEKPIEAKC